MFNLKNALAALMAFICMNVQITHAMEQVQPNITISVRYHHPSGISLCYFSLASGSNLGHLHAAISQKLGTDIKDQRIIIRKSYMERHPDARLNNILKVKKVLQDFQRPLENDADFGIPIVKETQVGRIIVGYTTPIFDLVCLPDFAYSISLANEYKILLEQNIIINRSNIQGIMRNGSISSQKYEAERTINNDFKEY